MDKALQETISALVGNLITNVTSVSGGDIARVYQIRTSTDRFLCKTLSRPEALDVFQCEKEGLDEIRATATIKTPQIYFCEGWENGAFLLMEFLDVKRPTESEMALFGRQLGLLHQQGVPLFGWHKDNYIGSLPQSNTNRKIWSQFYVKERLRPQLETAKSNGMLSDSEIPSDSSMLSVIEDLCSGVKPSLLHGDLWGGNYLISSEGIPYLIDPAVYYGHSEVDIAMSRLFGGFGQSFYQAYEEIMPPDTYSPDRIKIYQLYYLLVHLNLFGASYYSGVNAIIKSYF